MPINANLKAQVQARINAAGNGSTLEELWNLKLIARGLGCNESNIDNLIELRLNEFGASTELKSLLQGALSVRSYARNIVWKTRTYLVSDMFTRPANMVGDTAWVTASAGGGGGTAYSTFSVVRGACGGCWCKDRPVSVPVGSSHSVLIGSGGNPDGQGGSTSFGTQLLLKGGSPAASLSTSNGSVVEYAATSDYYPAFIKAEGVHPGLMVFVAPFEASNLDHKSSALHIPTEMVNGFIGVGIRYAPPLSRYIGDGPAAGFFGAPVASYNDATPINTGCGGWSGYTTSGRNGSAGRLDISWWEYEE